MHQIGNRKAGVYRRPVAALATVANSTTHPTFHHTMTRLRAKTAKNSGSIRRRSPSPSGRGIKGEGEPLASRVAFAFAGWTTNSRRSPSPRPSPAGRGRIAFHVSAVGQPLWLRRQPRCVPRCGPFPMNVVVEQASCLSPDTGWKRCATREKVAEGGGLSAQRHSAAKPQPN